LSSCADFSTRQSESAGVNPVLIGMLGLIVVVTVVSRIDTASTPQRGELHASVTHGVCASTARFARPGVLAMSTPRLTFLIVAISCSIVVCAIQIGYLVFGSKFGASKAGHEEL
jgi:hypothetical protein